VPRVEGRVGLHVGGDVSPKMKNKWGEAVVVRERRGDIWRLREARRS